MDSADQISFLARESGRASASPERRHTRSSGGGGVSESVRRTSDEDRGKKRKHSGGDGGGSSGSDDEDDKEEDDDDGDSGFSSSCAGENSGGWTCLPDKSWVFEAQDIEYGFDKWGNTKSTHSFSGIERRRKKDEAHFQNLAWWGRGGDYCWLCEVKQSADVGGRNEVYEQIMTLASKWSDKDPLIVCGEIEDYYAAHVMPYTAKIWSKLTIYLHFTQHKPSPLILVDENIRLARRMIESNERHLYHDRSSSNLHQQKNQREWIKTIEQSLKTRQQFKGSIR